MMEISTAVAKDICDALGLKNVRRLDLHFAFDEVATATVEFFPDSDGVAKLPVIVKRYRMIELPK